MRQLNAPTATGVTLWAVVAVGFQLYTAGFGFLEPLSQRAVHLALFLPLAFILFPATARSRQDAPSWPDLALAALALAPCAYAWLHADRINLRIEGIDALRPEEAVLGALLTALLIEAVRRAVATALAVLCGVILLYLSLTEHAPGFLHFRDLPATRLAEILYLGTSQGIFGFVTGISATMVAVFVIFGAFVEGSGAGRLFTNLGMRVAGRFSGGPAKVAVLSSALMGTMSGSSSANVVTTGSFTIPMMKRLGYGPAFAGAVETSASVGGQLMPPIMGAAAFIMAETTRTPYATIATAAILGSLCYFYTMILSVHFEARTLGLEGLSEADLPGWRDVRRDTHLLLPILLLCALLFMKFSPHLSAFWSIAALLPVSWLRRHTRITPGRLLAIARAAAGSTTVVALACASANIVITGLTITGLTVSLGGGIMGLSSGSLLVAGALLMFCTMAMGMGVPTSAAYAITASIGAPILARLGVELIPAHLFVLYFAVLADATPPVSIAAFVAASIAKADPLRTGLQALRLAVAGFVVGFSYLMSPALTLQGGPGEIVTVLATTLLTLTILSLCLAGRSGRPSLPVRLPAAIFALLAMLMPDLPGFVRLLSVAAILAFLLLLGRHAGTASGSGAQNAPHAWK